MSVARPDALDDADPLVTRDKRQRRLDRPLATRGMDIRVTQAGRLDANEHLLRARLGDRDILDRERAGEVMHDSGLHSGAP
jgi:hypothetical protein